MFGIRLTRYNGIQPPGLTTVLYLYVFNVSVYVLFFEDKTISILSTHSYPVSLSFLHVLNSFQLDPRLFAFLRHECVLIFKESFNADGQVVVPALNLLRRVN